MAEKQFLYNKGFSYKGFFVCPIKQHNGFTYRCLSSQENPEIQLGNGLFETIVEALEAAKKYLDRELQYQSELSHYQNLLETDTISHEDYHTIASSLDQAIWGLL